MCPVSPLKQPSTTLFPSEKPTYTVPLLLQFIWIGGKISKADQIAFKVWRTKNPAHKVHLWVDSNTLDLDTKNEIKSFCRKNDIQPKDIHKLEFTNANNAAFYNKALELKLYGMASDIVRVDILTINRVEFIPSLMFRL